MNWLSKVAQPHAAVLAEEESWKGIRAALLGSSERDLGSTTGCLQQDLFWRDLPPNQGLARKGLPEKAVGDWCCHQQECLGSPWQGVVRGFEGAECEATGVLSITSQITMRTCLCWWQTGTTNQLQNLFALLVCVLYFSERNTVYGSHSEIFCVWFILWEQYFFFKLVHVDLRLGNILMVIAHT